MRCTVPGGRLLDARIVDAKYVDGVYAMATYTSYGACMYRKPATTNDDTYRCVRMGAGAPWHVGKIRGTGDKD
jgi:hypothetical protein